MGLSLMIGAVRRRAITIACVATILIGCTVANAGILSRLRARTGYCASCNRTSTTQATAVWHGQRYISPICNSPNCTMCNAIRAQLARRTVAAQPDGEASPSQQSSDPQVRDAALEVLQLTRQDTLADIGCGDGNVLIAACERYGCRGLGIEIDPARARIARRRVRDAGLGSQITIVTGDAAEADLSGVTAAYVYLWQPNDRAVRRAMARKLRRIRRVVAPIHPLREMRGRRIGDVWIYRAEVNTTEPTEMLAAWW